MFANFFQLLTRRTDTDYEAAFIRDVDTGPRPTRNPQVERLIWVGWILIVFKSLLVAWACSRYPVPFHPLWIIGPTVAFAALCTGVYLWRR